MQILFFTEISPFPINGGERIRSYGILKALSELNYSVTAVVQNSDNVSLNSYSLKNIKYIEYSNREISKYENIMLSYFFKLDKNVLQIFDSELLFSRPDVVILDFFLAGRYYKYFKKVQIPIIIGTHNAESKLIWQRPSNSILKFLRKFQNYAYMKIHERIFYRQCDSIITVSQNDYEFYSKFISRSKIFMIPNFLDESRYLVRNIKENYFAMTANFGPFMNVEGLKWLIEEVWDENLDEKYTLKIIGKFSIQAVKSLKSSGKYKNIYAIGEVENMLPYISKAKAVLIPLLHGSGTRLKCLEAMALETPIISTSKGVEGIKSKNIIIANSIQEFRNAIDGFKANEEIGMNLYKEFMSEYSLKTNVIRLKELIESSVKV
jgi:glycosyltransferase involved in cell wall biosynthesis